MNDKAQRWDRFVREICRRQPETLSEMQQNAVLCYQYDVEMRRGGHGSYLDAYPRVRTAALAEALKAVATEDFARNFREAASYGGRDNYREADAIFNAFVPSLRDYLQGYVEQHRDAIFAEETEAQKGRRGRKKKGGGLRSALRLAILLLVVYIAVTTVSIISAQNVDETQKADVIIVLGAAAEEAGVSPVFRERLNHGVQLYQDGYAGKLLLTGGVGEGNTRSDAAIARDYALEQGVAEADILLEERSTITEENLKYAKAIMDQNSLETALLVSDPLHMARALLMARDYGITVYSSPTSTSMYRTLEAQLPFLMREELYYVGYRWIRLLRGILPEGFMGL